VFALPSIQTPSSYLTGHRRSTPAYTPPTLSYAPPTSTPPGGLPPPPTLVIPTSRTRSGANAVSRNPLQPEAGVIGVPLPRTGGTAAPPEGFKKLRMAGARHNYSPIPLYQIPTRPHAPPQQSPQGGWEGTFTEDIETLQIQEQAGSGMVGELSSAGAHQALHGLRDESPCVNENMPELNGESAAGTGWDSCEVGVSGAREGATAADKGGRALRNGVEAAKVDAPPKMSKKRLEQLQECIGSARTKQDKWTTKVRGGGLFKKNQEMSFVENLEAWHSAGFIRIHQLPSANPLPWENGGDDACVLRCEVAAGNQDVYPGGDLGLVGWTIQSQEKWHEAKRSWFCNGGDVSAFKPNSFNMCLRHMGFRPTKGSKGAKYGTPGTGYDWEGSPSFVFDSELRVKYASKRSNSAVSRGNKRKRDE